MTEGSSALSEEIVERDVSLRDLLMLGSGGFAGALWITVGRTGLSLLSETLGRPGLGIRQLDLVLCLGLTVMLSSNEGLRMDGGLELLVSGKEIWCREEEGRAILGILCFPPSGSHSSTSRWASGPAPDLTREAATGSRRAAATRSGMPWTNRSTHSTKGCERPHALMA